VSQEPENEVRQASQGESSPPQEMKREIIEFVKMIAWFLVLFFIVKTYVIEGYEVQGPSMIPTLKDGERILVLKFPHTLSRLMNQVGFTGIQALTPGDVVVFDSPSEPNKRYVKRVVAKGIQKSGNVASAQQSNSPESDVSVRFDHGAVYVNNKRLSETYLPPDQSVGDESTGAVHLVPGTYYVMGDNRGVSKDSRSFGAVDDNRVIGRACVCFWPPKNIRLIK
jgi:signal peptidase I